jgi:hypothetical protein
MAVREGTATISIDGEETLLVLDFNALAEYEGRTGDNVMELFFKIIGSSVDEDTMAAVAEAKESGADPTKIIAELPATPGMFATIVDSLGITRCRGLLWAGLLETKGEGFTMKQAGELFAKIDAANFSAKYTVLVGALTKALFSGFASGVPNVDAAPE